MVFNPERVFRYMITKMRESDVMSDYLKLRQEQGTSSIQSQQQSIDPALDQSIQRLKKHAEHHIYIPVEEMSDPVTTLLGLAGQGIARINSILKRHGRN